MPTISKRRFKRRMPKPLTSPTPRSPTAAAESSGQDDQSAISARDSQSLFSPFATPPTSPSSPSTDPTDTDPTMQSSTDQTQTIFNPNISADDIISKDIVAIADIFATMKKTLLVMTNAFDRLGIQSEKFTSLSLDIKAVEQVCPPPIVTIVLCRLTLYCYHLAESSAQSLGRSNHETEKGD